MPISRRSSVILFRVGAVLALAGVAVWWFRGHDSGAVAVAALSSEVAVGDSSPSLAAASTPSPAVPPVIELIRDPTDKFSETHAKTERWIHDASGDPVERWRLIELPKDPGRLARVVDRVERDKASGQWRIVGQDIMAPDSVVVVVPDGSTPEALVGRLRGIGLSARPTNRTDAVVAVQLPEATLDAVPDALAAIASKLPDLTAEPNFLLFPFQATPPDYDGIVQWGLENVEAPAAWTVSTGSASVVVAVIDTGIDRTHPDLSANIWTNPGEIAGNGIDDDNSGFVDDVSGWNFADANANPSDQDDHGTHVSGIIGAVGDNGAGVIGVNWNVRLIPLRVGNRTFESANTLNALRYVNTLKQNGVNIVAVNASFGGSSFSAAFRDELIKTRDNGVLFVAAAGNDGSNNDNSNVFPSGYDVANVIAVASIHPGNARSTFSNFGRFTVDLAAPGTAIRSTIRNGGYDFFNGTSMAAPHVTGAAALVAAANPTLTWSEVRDRLLQGVDPVPALTNLVETGGKLNVRRAVAPQLVPPRIEIVTPSVEVVLIDRPGVPQFLVATLPTENGVTPTADVAWETVEGPAAVVFSAPDEKITNATFPLVGRYWLRVRATSGGFTHVDDLVVAVGYEGTQAPTNGLEALWRFDETGGTAIDASGAGRTGVITGGPSRVAGIERGGLDFDGFNGKVAFNSPTLQKFTLAGWMFPSATNGVSIFPRVVHMREGMLFLGRDFSSGADDGNFGTLKFARDDGESARVWFAPPGTWGSGRWTHVAATFDPAAGAEATPGLYYDGKAQVVGIQPSQATPPAVQVGQGFIGDRGDGGRVWGGALDEIAIYSRELSHAELAVMARAPRMRACLDSAVGADLSQGTTSFPVSFTAAAGAPNVFSISMPTWSAVGASAQGVLNGSTNTTVIVPAAGAYVLKLEMIVDQAILVVRTLPVTVTTTAVASTGRFSGTTSDGEAFLLDVGPGGLATFVGASGGGLFQENVPVSAYGTFSFTTRSGRAVSGEINSAGTVSGVIGSGGVFFGSKNAVGLSNAAIDGIYDGWVVDTGVRAAANVTAGTIALTIEENGAGRAALGEVDGDGGFELGGNNGFVVVGGVSSGRINAFVAASGVPPREVVLFRASENPVRRLVNLSARGLAGAGDNALIAGFGVSGSSQLPVLVRGVGPGLAEFGVGNVLAAPHLALHSGAVVLAVNHGWDAAGNGAIVAPASDRVGAFPLEPGSADTAVLASVSAGAFTALVSADSGVSGTVLAEVYDASETAVSGALVNLSTRAFVGEGDSVLIGGFVVEGDAPSLVLVRAAGPALGALGVGNPLALTELSVWRDTTMLASSEAWSEGEGAALIAQAAVKAGAFSFADRSADAALLVSLPPGHYTAQVRGREAGTGVALVEIYLVNDL